MSEFADTLRQELGSLTRIARGYEANPATVEELVQDIALAAYRAWPNFRREANPRTYLCRIAHNVCIDHVRKSVRMKQTQIDDEFIDSAPLPDEISSENQKRHLMLRAVQALPLTLRQVITLHLEDYSHAEIAEMLGLSANNVAVRIARGKSKLIQQLKDVV